MATPAPSVLVFYPHNFTRAASGTEKRFVELLEYFAERNIPVDVFSLSGFSNHWNDADLQRHPRHVRNLFVHHWPSRWRLVGRTILRTLSGTLANHALPGLKRAFGRQASKGNYSHIIISYAYWADLIDAVPGDVVKIIDLHDVLTFNRFHLSGAKRFRLGRMLESELDRISKFDAALSISPHETTMLRSLCPGTEFHDVPMSLPTAFSPDAVADYDLIFVGSANPFNVDGLGWFLQDVLPLLDATIRVVVVGSVSQSVKHWPDNVTAVPFAETLHDYYRVSRLAICPLFGGSGLKIKVVEALAHGRPVVANDAGLAGLPDAADKLAYIRANGPAEFAAAIGSLLSDPLHYSAACQDARDYFSRHFGREVAWTALDRVFADGCPRPGNERTGSGGPWR